MLSIGHSFKIYLCKQINEIILYLLGKLGDIGLNELLMEVYSTSTAILESNLALGQIKSVIPCGSAIPHLSIYPKEIPIHVHKVSCTRIFMEALFVVVGCQKQSGCPWQGRE